MTIGREASQEPKPRQQDKRQVIESLRMNVSGWLPYVIEWHGKSDAFKRLLLSSK